MNNLLSEHQHGLSHENLDPPTYSLISIGQRGSGKTVFLTSSYAQSKLGAANGSRGHWALECEDPEAEEKIKNVLN